MSDDLESINSVTYTPLVQQALHALHSLNPVERAVLNLRFGLDDGEEHDREEVARHYGVSVEIIRNVETEALRKLKNPDRFCQQKNRSKKSGPKSHLYLVQ